MSPVRIIILVGAAAAAGGAAFLMRGMSAPSATAAATAATVIETKEVSEVKVLVAKRDFKVGDVLSSGDLTWAPWPEHNLIAEYYTEKKAPKAAEELTGAVVKMPVFKGEPLHPVKIVVKGDTSTMTALIEPGMRAMALEISEDNAAGGFILPNDRVDVVLTYGLEIFLEDKKIVQNVSSTIIQNVRVLAIDQEIRPPEGDKAEASQIGNTATLELTAEESELMALSLTMGDIALSLRSWQDSGPDVPRRARTDLLTNPRALEDNATIKMIRSGVTTES